MPRLLSAHVAVQLPARLQTGMRGAWGKPYGTVARVDIGQILLSVRCKDSNAHVIQEALRRARYKFPGRQKIIISKKWGFTNVNREAYLKLKEDKRVVQYVDTASIPREVNTDKPSGTALMYSSFARKVLWRPISALS